MFAPYQQNNNYQGGNPSVKVSASDFQTLQNARRDLIGEIQAIIDYDEHIYVTSNEVAKRTWIHIRDEELNHVGELLSLLAYLEPSQKPLVMEGMEEFKEWLNPPRNT